MNWLRCSCVLVSWVGVGIAQEKGTNPYVFIYVPNLVRIGEPFAVSISLQPPSDHIVAVTMRRDAGISYSPSSFQLKPGQRRSIEATIRNSASGIDWIAATAEGYDDGWNTVVSEFQGQLKLNSTAPLPYDIPTTLTISVLDRSGRSVRFGGDMELELESADGVLGSKSEGNRLKLTVPPGARSSSEFQFRPKSVRGGTAHLNSKLTVSGNPTVLEQEEFNLSAEPAWWLPITLAILGGLLHAIYKLARSLGRGTVQQQFASSLPVLITSAVAAFVGYLTTNLDLLGLKLDPNVLRTYVLVGFLFSYFGLEVLLASKLSGSTSRPKAPEQVKSNPGINENE